jgi:hypothetical protein
LENASTSRTTWSGAVDLILRANSVPVSLPVANLLELVPGAGSSNLLVRLKVWKSNADRAYFGYVYFWVEGLSSSMGQRPSTGALGVSQ